MSKFIDKLKQVVQPPPPPMGFRPKNIEDSRPRIQLVARLQDSRSTKINSLNAVDAVILPEVKTVKTDIIHGIWLEKGAAEGVDKATEAGADFVVFPVDNDLLSPDKTIGKIMQINASITDVLLRTVNDLPLDAVLIDDSENDGAGTWQKLMLCRRFTSLLTKPVLVPISPSVTATELQLFWDAKVCGVVVEVKSDADVTALENLRKLIKELKYPSPKKQEKLMPILPQTAAKAEKLEEPDEDDDDD